jgi:putative ABC transport system permease protein
MIARMALRNLGRNRRRTAFVTALIALGAIVAMIAAGFMAATYFVVKESAIRSGLGHFQIAKAGEFNGYKDFPMQHGLAPREVARVMAALPADAQALPRIAFEGVVSSGDRSLVFLATGVDPDAERMLGDWSRKLVAGSNLTGGDADNIYRVLLGAELARLLGVKPGQSLTMMTPTAAGGLNAADVTVVGLVSEGVRDIDRMRIVAPMGLAKELMGTDRIDRVSVLLTDEAMLDAARTRAAAGLSQGASRSWRELSPLYDQLVALYNRQFAVFGVVIGLMIGIAVINTVAMAVLERSRETATLMALGFPRGLVRRMFLAEGAAVALLGSIAGLAIGWLLIRLINGAGIQMPPAPGSIEGYQLYLMTVPWAALATLAVLLLLGTFAGWAASGSIRSDRIVEGLRHD